MNLAYLVRTTVRSHRSQLQVSPTNRQHQDFVLLFQNHRLGFQLRLFFLQLNIRLLEVQGKIYKLSLESFWECSGDEKCQQIQKVWVLFRRIYWKKSIIIANTAATRFQTYKIITYFDGHQLLQQDDVFQRKLLLLQGADRFGFPSILMSAIADEGS